LNVIVIVTDSLRGDHCGCYPMCVTYNGHKVETPNLDRLAADGVTFLHAYSESLPTIPTRTSWWTGRVGFPSRGWQPFELGDYLLAEVLWDKGFTSALVTDTYHMHKPVFNCGRGFDSVVWIRGQESDPWIVDGTPTDLTRWHRFRGEPSDADFQRGFEHYLRSRSTFKREEDWFAPRVSREAIRWLTDTVENKGSRDNLFLWVDFFDPHEPWDPPEPYWSMYREPDYQGQDIIDPIPGPTEGYLSSAELQRIKSLYAGEVTFVDKWAGKVIECVRDLGLYDDSLILWLSDHGEPFGEHGIICKARPWNYEELVRIPWVMKLPTSLGFDPPAQVDALVQPTDVMPTILDALGIETPLPLVYRAPLTAGTFPQDMAASRKDISLHGHSLLPLLRGETDKVRDYAYSGHHLQCWSIQNHEWRYLLFLQYPYEQVPPDLRDLIPADVFDLRKPELFHRPTDPYDQQNVIEQHPEVAAALELELRRWVANLDA
jgi:arylsulfatase A-like enzyme